MNIRTYIIIVFVTAALSFQMVEAQPAMPVLESEPALHTRLDWEPYPNGLMSISYDRNHNAKPDLITLRVILTHYESELPLKAVASKLENSHIFSVPYQKTNHYYVISGLPIFYAMDLDEDGVWDLIFKDPGQDGVNGNEVPYESPSAMFNIMGLSSETRSRD